VTTVRRVSRTLGRLGTGRRVAKSKH